MAARSDDDGEEERMDDSDDDFEITSHFTNKYKFNLAHGGGAAGTGKREPRLFDLQDPKAVLDDAHSLELSKKLGEIAKQIILREPYDLVEKVEEMIAENFPSTTKFYKIFSNFVNSVEGFVGGKKQQGSLFWMTGDKEQELTKRIIEAATVHSDEVPLSSSGSIKNVFEEWVLHHLEKDYSARYLPSDSHNLRFDITGKLLGSFSFRSLVLRAFRHINEHPKFHFQFSDSSESFTFSRGKTMEEVAQAITQRTFESVTMQHRDNSEIFLPTHLSVEAWINQFKANRVRAQLGAIRSPERSYVDTVLMMLHKVVSSSFLSAFEEALSKLEPSPKGLKLDPTDERVITAMETIPFRKFVATIYLNNVNQSNGLASIKSKEYHSLTTLASADQANAVLYGLIPTSSPSSSSSGSRGKLSIL